MAGAGDGSRSAPEVGPSGGIEVEADRYGPERGDYRERVRQAWEVLVRDQALSIDEAYRYLCERAQADSLFIDEVARRILEARRAPRTEGHQESASTEGDCRLSCPSTWHRS